MFKVALSPLTNRIYCGKSDRRKPNTLIGNIELLEEMADYLNQNGYEDVAKDTRRLVEYIKSAKIRVETLFEMLSPVFKAVEWYCSADWGKDRVDKAIEEYRN